MIIYGDDSTHLMLRLRHMPGRPSALQSVSPSLLHRLGKKKWQVLHNSCEMLHDLAAGPSLYFPS